MGGWKGGKVEENTKGSAGLMAGSREHLSAAIFCMKSETKSLAQTEWEGGQLGVREGRQK